ncbi:hypothetical protein VY88_10250 [Azospirillum thiophilum]|uniref:Resolvase HTH domain-containing protein n=1 Tax=Azospirillum thiophilum TaxID=528244 RepID=A0AAC8ZTB7_9PROT|nr:hypothetical protein [Azospirillum thiophilum]ALG69971.1 hypothetical protein AL072_02460 [Azospirillum thiophilum]KJR66342.1 hypothetical protein VY88_10250 [Azospirillum thiophilum]
MRILYIHSSAPPTADLLDRHAAAIAGARVLRDSSAEQAGRDTLLTLLVDGDELLVPGLEHLGATSSMILASLRRAVEVGARVTLLHDGIDGASILRAAALLEALPDAADMPSPRRDSRPYRRATPERVAEILALSASGMPIRVIAETVGLSSGTVMRVRRIHRVLPHSSWPSDCLGSAD